jgi:geranylgeranyl pyrophosphate synthase
LEALSGDVAPDNNEDIQLLRSALLREVPVQAGIEFTMGQVLTSAVTNPGSLWRAQLALGVGRALGLPCALALKFACAVEYFHIASLLLDDLPQMDDAHERRGQVCLHLLHGENSVLLAALALITRGYALAGEYGAGAPESARLALNALLESCLGTRGILNGQARDLKFHTKSTEHANPLAVALRKTVPLLLLSLLGPALVAGVSEEVYMGLRRLGIYWGLAYQGLDDLRDVVESSAESGKTAERDFLLGRPNLGQYLGVHAAYRKVTRLLGLSEKCLLALNAKPPLTEPLAAFQRRFSERVGFLSQA